MKKYSICLVVSVILALLMPLVVMDMYEPLDNDHTGNQIAWVDGQNVELYDSREMGLREKLAFYFTDFASFKVYMEYVLPWFLGMFLSAALSTYFIHRLQNHDT